MARKDFSNLVDAVGDQLLKDSFICVSLLKQILALSLSRPPYELSLVLKAHFTGMILSAGSAFLFVSDASLSNSPCISFLIASPHLSLTDGDSLRTLFIETGSGMNSDKFICDS